MAFCGFQRRLVEAMDAKGTNCCRLAPSVHRDRKTVLAWRHGKNMPDAESVYQLCVALDVSADWLLGTGR